MRIPGLASVIVGVALASAPTTRIEEWPRTIVAMPSAALYSAPDASSRMVRRLPKGGVVRVRSNTGTWADVFTYSPSLGNADGWMRSQDLVSSDGMTQYWKEQFENAVALLTVETRREKDPVVAAWLQFHLGYAQWATGAMPAARATFEAAGHDRDSMFAPYAWLAAAKLAVVQDDTTTAIAEYQDLLATFPAVQLPGDCFGIDTISVHWPNNSSICYGLPSIATRIERLQTYAEAKAGLARVLADRTAAPVARAEARLTFARAFEQRDNGDPVVDPTSDSRSSGVLQAYQAVVHEAPASIPAGFAAWKVIEGSQGEWEGDWEAKAAWVFDKYGGFIAGYPAHELVPDAKLKIAEATWGKGGYVAVFHYTALVGAESERDREAILDRWFDARGFGGPLHDITLHPDEAVKAQQMFREIVAESPASPAAAMAQYYVAVIFDYCLNEPAKALPEFEAFVTKYPKTEPFVDKARKRIAAIRGK